MLSAQSPATWSHFITKKTSQSAGFIGRSSPSGRKIGWPPPCSHHLGHPKQFLEGGWCPCGPPGNLSPPCHPSPSNSRKEGDKILKSRRFMFIQEDLCLSFVSSKISCKAYKRAPTPCILVLNLMNEISFLYIAVIALCLREGEGCEALGYEALSYSGVRPLDVKP